MNEYDVFDINFGSPDFSFYDNELTSKSKEQKEFALIECDYCNNAEMEVIESNMNKIGQLITVFKCPICGHIETICEVGNGKRISREN